MPFLPKSTIKLSAQHATIVLFCVSVLILLVGRRFDAVFAGGEGLGAHIPATLVDIYDIQNPQNTVAPPFLPPSLNRGETVTTNATTFARYTLDNACTLALAENSSLTVLDSRSMQNIVNLLTGRAVASGDCTLSTRETRIRIRGVATVIHFSWLDEIVVQVFEGDVDVNQSGTITHLTPESSALRLSTLPATITQKATELSLTQNEIISSFYRWSLIN